jgi:hypothetical protein
MIFVVYSYIVIDITISFENKNGKISMCSGEKPL